MTSPGKKKSLIKKEKTGMSDTTPKEEGEAATLTPLTGKEEEDRLVSVGNDLAS